MFVDRSSMFAVCGVLRDACCLVACCLLFAVWSFVCVRWLYLCAGRCDLFVVICRVAFDVNCLVSVV